ncbi:MAG: ATPase, T2SS/T4P/T4SS family, partial [archaeon]
MDSVLGWKLQNPAKKEINKVLRHGKHLSVVEAKNLEKYYLLEYFPQLSGQEEVLLKNIFDAFLDSKKEEKSQKGILQTMHDYCENNLVELDENQQKYIAKILELMVFEFGPISCFLKDPLIEEISVIGIGGQKPVYVYEKNFGWLKSNLFFLDEQAVKNLANRMGRAVGRHLSLQNPNLNAFLPDGSRINACIDPVALEPVLTIRKFKEQPFTPIELVENNTISARAVAFLWLALQTDCSVLVCGNTGSGKTTTLNALFCLIPKDERIVVTEETPEISLVQEHVVNLKTVENIGVKIKTEESMHFLI